MPNTWTRGGEGVLVGAVGHHPDGRGEGGGDTYVKEERFGGIGDGHVSPPRAGGRISRAWVDEAINRSHKVKMGLCGVDRLMGDGTGKGCVVDMSWMVETKAVMLPRSCLLPLRFVKGNLLACEDRLK